MSENQYIRPNQPDVLEVIANLSSNEVFTPPRVVNAVLDLLPENVWTNPNLRWLDPGSKTGVFPREIAKRLMVGLEDEIKDEAERLHHILTNMVFAIAITDMTAMMTRRSLYCSKDASSDFAASSFSTSAGNVWYERVEHSFDKKGRCTECGGTKDQLEKLNRDNYAYAFIHAEGRTKFTKETTMKFDVIVGNPPYQMDADGGNRTMPIYDQFIQEAKKIAPLYLAFIIPSRWIASGLGLGGFRQEMLNDARIRTIVDFPNAEEVFPGVGKSIKGGVMYFLWDRDYSGKCSTTLRRGLEVIGPHDRVLNEYDVFVRDTRALSILTKVLKKKETSLTEFMAADKEFGMTSNFSGWNEKKAVNSVPIYLYKNGQRIQGWMKRSGVAKSTELIDTWKVLVPQAGSDGGQRLPDAVLGSTIIASSPSVCTQTYLFVMTKTSEEAVSIDSYFKTRFLRFLVSLRKVTQHATRSTYTWVPQQTWDRTWTDAELYKKYGITKEEQEYIESMVKEMPA